MPTISVEVSKKEGTDHYGSIGAAMRVDGIPVPPDMTVEQIAELRSYWYRLCDQAVSAELAQLRGAPGRPAAPPDRDPAPPPRRERSDWGTADDGRAARPTDGRTRPRDDGGRRVGGAREERAPRTGRGLWAALKDHDERDGTDLVAAVKRWGKQQGLDGRMVEWDERDVADAWRIACDRLEALREGDSLQRAGRDDY